MKSKTKIKEIFTSIQGEGPYIGVKQLFIRFCGCNLECKYCDTAKEADGTFFEFTPAELSEHIKTLNLKSIHSISITGGEPLLWSEFLEEFLPLVENKVYLETNSTLNSALEKIINNVDIIAADIKLPSASGIENSFAIHDEFFKSANKYGKEIFAKIVFDENILNDEIDHCIKLAEKHDLELILQPKMDGDTLKMSDKKITEIFEKFVSVYPKTRVIPQVHKFLRVQ